MPKIRGNGAVAHGDWIELAGDSRPLLFQNDHSILLMVDAPAFSEARDRLREFAELRQAAGPYHVYRLTDTSLWSAAASQRSSAGIIEYLIRNGQNAPPASLLAHVQRVIGNYGLFRLTGNLEDLRLVADDLALLRNMSVELGLSIEARGAIVPRATRGWVKAALAERGYPVVDEAALAGSVDFDFGLEPDVRLRPYQEAALRRFCRPGISGGVVLLPCGSGKTVVGVAVAAFLNARTLVISPSRTIGEQWIEHFKSMTSIAPDEVAIYRRGSAPTPITVATYQALTAAGERGESGLADVLDQPWGLIIYDEVHSLPADVFRQSAAVQSMRRLGLTATLVREDGREREVFSLVGPTIYSTPWRELERHAWIAPVDCFEVRVTVPDRRRLSEDTILAAKLKILRKILSSHDDEACLIVAHRLKEVAAAARVANAAIITGQTPSAERRRLYQAFREGGVSRLALSRVANVGVDLPDASLLIQLSGAFGSRQEEAQRVGRVLRPKTAGKRARFYTLVMAGTREVEFAARRQRFLIDQGYRYRVFDVDAG